MKNLLLAFQFLTVIPLRIKEVSEKNLAGAMIYFPFVGLLLGLLLCAISALLCFLNLPALLVNIILAVALIVITGGMHLDGLADTADAFLSGKPKDQMLSIMRDSHIGVMGVLSLISAILLKVGLLLSLGTSAKMPALVLMCVLSRWGAVLIMFLFPYARQEGKAKVFISGVNLKIFSLSTLAAFIFTYLAWQMKGLVVLLIVAGCAYLAGKAIIRKINGITGDTLGAMIEISEIITLFAVCLG